MREREGVTREQIMGSIFFCFIFLKVQLECKEGHFGKSLSSHQICS